MAELRFEKWHGTGNDFVMVEDWDGDLDLPEDLVAALCDRHLGVGADGLIRSFTVGSPDCAAVRWSSLSARRTVGDGHLDRTVLQDRGAF